VVDEQIVRKFILRK